MTNKKFGMANDHTSAEYLTIGEACNMLKKTRQTLYNWRNKGIIQATNIAGNLYIKKQHITDMLENNYGAILLPKKFGGRNETR